MGRSGWPPNKSAAQTKHARAGRRLRRGSRTTVKEGVLSEQHQHSPIDIHTHYYPETFLKLAGQHAAACGVDYKVVPGKGPQFKNDYLVTTVSPRFVDLDAR